MNNNGSSRTSIVLTHKERQIMNKLREHTGMSNSHIIRVALRRFDQLVDTAEALVLNTVAREIAGKGRNPRAWDVSNHHK